MFFKKWFKNKKKNRFEIGISAKELEEINKSLEKVTIELSHLKNKMLELDLETKDEIKITVEGAIGCGKTTFIAFLYKLLQENDFPIEIEPPSYCISRSSRNRYIEAIMYTYFDILKDKKLKPRKIVLREKDA